MIGFHIHRSLNLIVAIIIFSLIMANPLIAQTSYDTYVVQRGENLFRIALKYGMTANELAQLNGISNPATIYVGQVLRVPGTSAPTPVPYTPAPAPITPATSNNTYIVNYGDTPQIIASIFGVSPQQLMQFNNLEETATLYVGQEILVPPQTTTFPTAIPIPAGFATPTPQPVIIPTVTPFSVAPTATPLSVSIATATFAPVDESTSIALIPELVDNPIQRGVELFPSQGVVTMIGQQGELLGFDWAKITLNWKDVEPERGVYDFELLDATIDALADHNTQILLTITTAPDWARLDENGVPYPDDGPPNEIIDWIEFLAQVVDRYEDKIDAYEIWDQPNVIETWNNPQYGLQAVAYFVLLEESQSLIELIDPDATVISAGLAPTSLNDGINAVDDRVYLQNLLDLGLADIADAIGVHPMGFANPPNARCCNPTGNVQTNFSEPHDYFLETLEDYQIILTESNLADFPLWVTSFGWGIGVDNQEELPAGYEYLQDLDESKQAEYVPFAFGIGEYFDAVDAMFLYNLNGCEIDRFACYYSLIGPDGFARDSYIRLLDSTILNNP